MTKRKSTLRIAAFLLLLCALLASCKGGSYTLFYKDEKYVNEKKGKTFYAAPYSYRVLEIKDLGKVNATIDMGKKKTDLFALKSMDPAHWLSDEDFNLYYSSEVTLPKLQDMQVNRISLVQKGAYNQVMASITNTAMILDSVEFCTTGTTIPAEKITLNPDTDTAYELLFFSALYPDIAYAMEYWTFSKTVYIYAKLTDDGQIPNLYPGIKAEIVTVEGERVARFDLGDGLVYDREADVCYAVGKVLESYFLTEP
jgi:hypothetical protein